MLPTVRAKDIYPVYVVDNIKKCPHLFKDGEQVVLTEKIHGTNFRFGYGGSRRFYYGTHRTNLSDTRGWFARARDYLLCRSIVNSNPGFGNPWVEAVENFGLREVCRDAPEYIFYAEVFGVMRSGKHVQPGFHYDRALQLRVFDAYNPKTRAWLTHDERRKVVWSMGLAAVPSLGIYEYSQHLVATKAEEPSWMWSGVREGIVVESLTGEHRKGKWVSEQYHLAKVPQE